MEIRQMPQNMPLLGLGTYKMTENDLEYIIPIALDLGYRLFDTAVGYHNERHLSRILQSHLASRNLTRSSIYIISKLRPVDHGYSSTLQSLQQSAEIFQGYVDLFLIHWPGVAKLSPQDVKNIQLRNESWRALQDAYDEGKYVKDIGVSNYTVSHLQQMTTFEQFKYYPSINQFELHPSYHPTDLITYCHEHHIHLQSYSTLGSGTLLTEEYSQQYSFLSQLIDKYSIILLQLIHEKDFIQYFPENPIHLSRNSVLASLYLAWARQSSFSVIPKSLNPTHLCLNMLSLSLQLTDEEMESINSIQDEQQMKICWDPAKVI